MLCLKGNTGPPRVRQLGRPSVAKILCFANRLQQVWAASNIVASPEEAAAEHWAGFSSLGAYAARERLSCHPMKQ
jgi:hypothetical protein